MFYNWGMLKAQELYRKIPFLKEIGRLLIAFLTAGVLGLAMPSVLGSGNNLIVSLTEGKMLLGMVVVTLIVKFLFSAVSFVLGCGGIFFPLLILGALIGAVFAMTGVRWFGLDPVYINNFVLLGMTGFFTAIVSAADRDHPAVRDDRKHQPDVVVICGIRDSLYCCHIDAL